MTDDGADSTQDRSVAATMYLALLVCGPPLPALFLLSSDRRFVKTHARLAIVVSSLALTFAAVELFAGSTLGIPVVAPPLLVTSYVAFAVFMAHRAYRGKPPLPQRFGRSEPLDDVRA